MTQRRESPKRGEIPARTEVGVSPSTVGNLHFESLCPGLEDAAASLLSLSFRDNPVNRAVIGGSRAKRERVNGYGMRASLAASRHFSFRRVVFECSEDESEQRKAEIAGTLIALDPGGYPVAAPPIAMQVRCLWGQGLRVMQRWAKLYQQLDACHPKEPHCYLALIATHPGRQKRGIGSALLTAWLRDVDERAMPSYLETDRGDLLGFYQAAGFTVVRELDAFGRPVWCMSRSAKPSCGAGSS